MKTAVIYTGLPRTFEFCVPTHKESFWSKYGIKNCFFHFWKNGRESAAPWSYADNVYIGDLNIETKLFDVFSPSGYEYEYGFFPKFTNKLSYPYRFEQFSEQDIFLQTLWPAYSNALSIRRAFCLFDEYCKKNNEAFDFVVLCRPDMLFEGTWPEIEEGKEYCFWDSLWICSPDFFKEFSEKVYYILEYALTSKEQNAGISAHANGNFLTPEHLNLLHLRRMGYRIEDLTPISMKKQIHRGSFIKN